jgi:hypothetical protein
VRGTNRDPREEAPAACELLVGRQAFDWRLDTTRE